jgi:hypothetical protein
LTRAYHKGKNMKSIREAAAQNLTWKLTKDTYELRSGADLVASLRWQKGSLFLGEAAEGRWTFKRTGFLRPKVTVRPENSSTDLATLGFSGSGGRLEFPDGRTYLWTASRAEWSLKNGGGEHLVRMKSMGTRGNLSGEVVLAPGALGLSDLSFLILLSWYVLVLQSKDVAKGEELMVGLLMGVFAGSG